MDNLWLPKYGYDLFVPTEIEDLFAIMAPADGSIAEHKKVAYLNSKSEELLATGDGKVLEEFMDLLNDEGMDPEYWVGRAEWIMSKFLNNRHI